MVETTEEIKENEQQNQEAPQEENCDPNTMDCSQMPKAMEQLIKEENDIERRLEKLDNFKNDFPTVNQVDDIKNSLMMRKSEINSKMDVMVERFSACSPPETNDESPVTQSADEPAENDEDGTGQD